MLACLISVVVGALVTLACPATDSEAPAPIRVGQIVTAELRSDAPQQADPAAPPSKVFTLVAESGGPITLSLDSYDFDPVLRVETPSGDLLSQDDNGGIAWNARLVLDAKSGERYRVLVTGTRRTCGEFTLAVTPGDAPLPFGDAFAKTAIAFHRTGAARASARADVTTSALHSLKEADLLRRSNRLTDSRALCESALLLAHRVGQRELEAWALDLAGSIAAHDRKPLEASTNYKASLAISQEIGSVDGVTSALHGLGWLEYRLDRYQRALTIMQSSLASAHRAGSPLGIASALSGIGAASHALGDYAGAREAYYQALHHAMAVHDGRLETRTLVELGGLALASGDYVEAQQRLTRAMFLARRIGDQAQQARAVGLLGSLNRVIGDLPSARHHYREQLALALECGDPYEAIDALAGLGMTHIEAGEPRRALPFIESSARLARALGDRWRQARELRLLGAARGESGDPAGAYLANKQALALAVEIGAREIELSALTHLGANFLNTGDYRRAGPHLDRAIAGARTIGDPAIEIFVLRCLSRMCFSVGRFSYARVYQDRGLRLARQLKKPLEELDAIRTLGAIEFVAGNLSRSVENLKAALALTYELGCRRESDTTLRMLAWIRMSQERHAEARVLFHRTLSLSIESADIVEQASAMSGLGNAHLLSKEYEHAKSWCRSASEVFEEQGDEERQLFPLLTIAQVAIAEQDAERCAQAVTRGEAILERGVATTQYAGDAWTWRAGWAEWAEVGQDLTALRLNGLRRGLLHRSLVVSEGFASADRWKGRELLQRITQLRAGTRWFEGVALRREQKEVLARRDQVLERLSESIRAGRPVAEVDALREESKALDAQAERLSRRLLVHSPQESSAEWSRRVDPEEVRGVLDEQTVLIEYAEGEERLYAYVLTARDLTFHDVGEKEAIYSDARALVALVSSPPNDGTTSFLLDTAKGLHASLVAPLLPSGAHGIQRLVIVPTPVLATLPFEALLASPPSGSPVDSLAKARFLIDDFEVSYAPSTSVLVELSAMGPRRKPGKALILADPVYLSEKSDPPPPPPADDLDSISVRGDRAGPHPREIPRLEKTRDEALSVAQLLARRGKTPPPPESSMRDQRSGAITTEYADLLFGAEASPEKLLRSLEDYSILHLAAHGFVDQEFPERSGLALAFTNEEDGYLGIEDVLDLDLDADLVVLSACATARGTVRFGEGVQSMARAFLFAGARRVVATLWKIADEEAAQTMSGFYRAMLESGMPPAAALRHAKRSLRSGLAGASTSSESLVHPFYWAPFIHIGLPR